MAQKNRALPDIELNSSADMRRLILLLMWPALAENLLATFVSIADTVMVSALGTLAVNGVGLVTQPRFIVLSAFMALGVGTTSLVARAKGENNPEKANSILWQSVLMAMVMVLAMTACGAESNAEASTADGTTPAQTAAPVTENAVYRTLYAAEVTTLNYLITGQTNELSIAANIVDGLVEYDSYGNVEPALALSWEQNEDATVWTFKIREGVMWVDKDGNEVAPVTAHDWVSSVYYACDANNDSSTA